MPHITILTVGKRKEKYLLAAAQEFEKRLSNRSIKYVQISQSNNLAQEAKQILAKLQPTDLVVVLEETGKPASSTGFAQLIKSNQDKSVVFLIGGAYGLDKSVKSRANVLLTLSTMTLTHEFAYVLLLEQLYRAYSILENKQYHK
jgi:23S rRNA (pseudouridine1915-N3)-methyltransferase